MKPLERCQLYTFIDTQYLHSRSVTQVAELLCAGGSDLIQLRAKGESPKSVKAMAEEILPITDRAGVGLVINDHPQVASAVGAHYCHLGQEDFFDAGYQEVSQVLPAGSRMRIGLSSHSPEQAQRALKAGAAYLGVGPVFATPTKPGAQPASLDYVRWATGHISIPWFAIGGITLASLDDVLKAGARRICVVSAILKAPDVVKACQEFKKRLPSLPISTC